MILQIDSAQVANQIVHSLDTTGWVLMFLGWLLYWLKQLDKARRSDTRSTWSVPVLMFLSTNAFEIPISLVGCLVIAMLGAEIPADLIDLTHGRLACLISGYSASSVVEGLIGYRKKQVP